MRDHSRRSARPPLGNTVLVGAPHRWVGRTAGGLPIGSLYVHRMGEWRWPRPRVSESKTYRAREPSTSRWQSAGFLFVFFAYTTITGFNYDVSSIGRSSVPFLTVADRYVGAAAVLAWITGIVSVLSTLSRRCQLSGTHALRRGSKRAPTGTARPYSFAIGHAGHCAAGHGWRSVLGHRVVVGIAPHKRRHG